MKVDPSKHYRMPLQLGPMFDYGNVPRLSYPEIDILAYQYLTQPQAVESL